MIKLSLIDLVTPRQTLCMMQDTFQRYIHDRTLITAEQAVSLFEATQLLREACDQALTYNKAAAKWNASFKASIDNPVPWKENSNEGLNDADPAP